MTRSPFPAMFTYPLEINSTQRICDPEKIEFRFMKKIIGFAILICTFATCQDSSQTSAERTQSLRDVGGPIAKEEAARWRARYDKSSTGFRQHSAPTISKTSLQHVVNAIAECDGVYFHNALEGDEHHVLLIPYKDGQSLWSTTVVVDANSDSMMEVATASLWAERYVAQNQDGPWSFFFGRHLLETILSNSEFEQMEIAPATSDAGVQLLLLYVTYGGELTNGRTQGTVEVYDQSNQCPPYCP